MAPSPCGGTVTLLRKDVLEVHELENLLRIPRDISESRVFDITTCLPTPQLSKMFANFVSR